MTREEIKLMYFDYTKKAKHCGQIITMPQLKDLVPESVEDADPNLELVVMVNRDA